MWSVLIGIALTIIVTIFLYMKYGDSWQHGVACTILLLTSVILPPALGFTAPYHEVLTTKRIDLVSIKDNTLIEGRIGGGIFVVGGYISESPVYFYYKKVGEGYVQDHIKAAGVVIYEDAKDGIGYITITEAKRVIDREWADKYLHWIIYDTQIHYRSKTTEIHVPKGTIIKEFVLDAE